LNLLRSIEQLSLLSHSTDTEAIIKLLDELIPNSSILQHTESNVKGQTSLLTFDV
jgi:hypothetical protein